MFISQWFRLLRLVILLSCLQLLGACASGTRQVKTDPGFSALAAEEMQKPQNLVNTRPQQVKIDPGFTPLAAKEIQKLQNLVNTRPIGERIAFWGEQFIGAPYDIDPLGEYVRSEKVVCDYRVDCMYLVFRAVELAQANTPEGAIDRSLDLRFRTRGRIEGGRVVNYDERFAYAETMISSGRWGRDITAQLGESTEIQGQQQGEKTPMLSRDELLKPEVYGKLKTGDLVFFVEDPTKRSAGEIIGHLGIVKLERGSLYLIHASGLKSSVERSGGGEVKKVDLIEYVAHMKFIGAKFTRFE